MTRALQILFFFITFISAAHAQNFLVIEDTLTLKQFLVKEKSDVEISLKKQPELGFISGDAEFGSVGIQNSSQNLIYWTEIDEIHFKPFNKSLKKVFFITFAAAGVVSVTSYLLSDNRTTVSLGLAPFGMIVSAFAATGIRSMFIKTQKIKMFDPAYHWYIQKYNKKTGTWEKFAVTM